MASETIKRMTSKLQDLLSCTITGEWGEECKGHGGVFVLRTTNFVNDGTIDFSGVVCRDIHQAKVDAKRLRPGDLIVEKSGGTKDHPVGRIVYFGRSTGTYLCNNFTQILRPDQSKVLPRYLFYALTAMYRMKVTESLYNKTTGIQNLQMRKYLGLDVRLPPLPAQRRIAAALDKIGEMKRNVEARLQKLDLLVKARFVKIFGDVKECCVRWGFEKLSKYCDLQNGYAFKSEDYVAESLVRNCRMSNIRPDATFDAEYHPKFLPNEYWDEFSSYRVSDGDVLIAMTDMATAPKILGVPTIVRTNGHRFLLNQRVGKLSFYHGLVIDKVFLMYYLATPFIRRQLARNAGGGLQINVGKPAIMGLEIPTPPLSLQRSFAAFVEKVDALKATAQASLERVDLLYRAKLQEYFG